MLGNKLGEAIVGAKNESAGENGQPYLQQKAELEDVERRRHELDAQNVRYEMEGQDRFIELETNERFRELEDGDKSPPFRNQISSL